MEWWQIGVYGFVIVYVFLILYQIYEKKFVNKNVEKIKQEMRRLEEGYTTQDLESESESVPEPEPVTKFGTPLISLESMIRNAIQRFLQGVFYWGYIALLKIGIVRPSPII